jgi:hypothetical protein
MRLIFILALLAQAACATSTAVQQPDRVRRAPLEKSGVKLTAPTQYEPRISSVDPKTGEAVYFNPKPQVVPVDEKAGKYAFKWIGYDGKEKTVIFQRFDAIDTIVSASVERHSSGQYLYTYKIENLPSSGSHLSGFIVQNFAADIKPGKVEGVFVGEMSKDIPQFSKGQWTSFGILPEFNQTVLPGNDITLQLASPAPPGLVACRTRGGLLGLKGAGEHMPSELEAAIPGYEQLPEGYTVGPIDKLTTLSQREHAQYILSVLPQAHKLGWITSGAQQWYEKNLTEADLDSALKRAGQDLKAGQVTTEVFSMIEGLRKK